MREKWAPKVGDVVAITTPRSGTDSYIERGRVERVLQMHIVVIDASGGSRKFNARTRLETGRQGWCIPSVELWTENHTAMVARTRVVAKVHRLAMELFDGSKARPLVESLPTTRVEEVASFLHALAAEARGESSNG